jgi:hypothetical protein
MFNNNKVSPIANCDSSILVDDSKVLCQRCSDDFASNADYTECGWFLRLLMAHSEIVQFHALVGLLRTLVKVAAPLALKSIHATLSAVIF